MHGVMAEQFPKRGALTLNATGGVGMVGVGVLAVMRKGNFQDRALDRFLPEKTPAMHGKIMAQS